MPDMLHGLRYRLTALFLAIFLMLPASGLDAALPLLPGQASVPLVVTTGYNQGYVIRVLSMRNGTRLFVDLESFARSLRLISRREQGSIVIDESLDSPGSFCSLMAGSNFARIVSRDPDLPKRIIQLRSPVALSGNRIVLPVTDACRIFELWLDRQISFSPTSEKISARFDSRREGGNFEATGVVGGEEEPRSSPPPSLPPKPAVSEPASSAASAPRSEELPMPIKGIEVDNRANGAIITVQASLPLVQASLLSPDAEGYAYFSLEKASCDLRMLSKIYSGGVVKSITPKKFEGGGVQLTISLDNRAYAVRSVELSRDEKNGRYVIYVRHEANVEEIHKLEKQRQIEKVISRDIEKWKLDTIVLDAGHGGKDPGAVGAGGTREKDVVINIVRDIGGFIRQKWPEVKVVYTRSDDTFIPLHERGRIANRNGGKLFVSVHCNASPSHSAHGSEVYILGPHKTKASLDVAMMENAVIRQETDYREQYKGFSEEYLIMSSMAQSAFIKQSTTLAQNILRPDERLMNTSRGVRQAGFMVLWTPSMPSALVEVGYLSNPREERVLSSREQQARLAWAIFQGIRAYRRDYEATSMAAMEQKR
ncbi:MAG: N-acetylmuramoyl-L-alanine amidase [Chlorobiaceae bacterium]|nr:N-acetylmuramoyl-L-alanine amidase [Chlorobiaceae bacterium]NTV60747.1 N-acetylmuramoyl-L-alanine amidase [Chlorobiaceae bacterium]